MDSEFIRLELFPPLKSDVDSGECNESSSNLVPKIPDSFFNEPIVDNDLTKKLKNIM